MDHTAPTAPVHIFMFHRRDQCALRGLFYDLNALVQFFAPSAMIIFLDIYEALRILLPIPVTAVQEKRSFSKFIFKISVNKSTYILCTFL